MSLQYDAPSISAQWDNERETHIAVATAIHAIASGARTPEVIWDDPTDAECDQVARAIEDYVANGVFSAEPDGRYPWGQDSVVIAAHISAAEGKLAEETEEWEAWEDGARDDAVRFIVPAGGVVDIAEAGAAALGVDVSERLNVARV